MKKSVSLYLLASLLFLFTKCKEAFEPEISSSPVNFLVIEGFLNTGGITTIKLSRTHSLTSTQNIPERSAQVVIEDENGLQFPLLEAGEGKYSAYITPSLQVRYRLKIKTKGKDYLSEYISIIKTPGIDEISWNQGDRGLQISVNTHDPENKTWYYRWEYEETWTIIPEFSSTLQVDSVFDTRGQYLGIRGIKDRSSANALPRVCWQSEISTRILLGSSKRLENDIIRLAPVSFVPYPSSKLASRYSILVKQYALTAQGFEYWENVKKNTEDLGSIFDPQPSMIKGNITCLSEPMEQVIGFFYGCTIEQKRVYINNSDLSWIYRSGCSTSSVKNQKDSLELIFPSYIPLYYEGNQERVVGTQAECADCRFKGTAVKPNFWIDRD